MSDIVEFGGPSSSMEELSSRYDAAEACQTVAQDVSPAGRVAKLDTSPTSPSRHRRPPASPYRRQGTAVMGAHEILDRGAHGEEVWHALDGEVTVLRKVDLGLGNDATGVVRQHDDPFAQEDCFLDVVGHHQDGRAGVLPDLSDEDLHVLFGLDVECAERLVEQQDLRFTGQRAREGNPLLLTTGQLTRQRVSVVRQTDLRQVPRDAAVSAPPCSAEAVPVRMRRCASTVRQGYSDLVWNTRPRSGPGPTTASPSRRISPSVGRDRPAISDSSVDFPEPLAPTTQMNSPGATCRSTASRTRWAPLGPEKSFATPRSSSLPVTPPIGPPGCVAGAGRRRAERRSWR